MEGKYLVHFGGGLGDMFEQIYQSHKFQAIPELIEKYDADIMCYCSVHNPACENLCKSLLLQDGTAVFGSYAFVPWSTKLNSLEIANKEGRQLLHFCTNLEGLPDDILAKSFALGNMYEFVYGETLDLQLPDEYIVIHPSGGTGIIDGLGRLDYIKLIETITGMGKYVIVIGATHNRVYPQIPTDDNIIEETPIDFKHDLFIDLTNRITSSQTTNIVLGASMFIGTHSAWCILAWHFEKPSICIMSEFSSSWGTWKQYLLDNGCRWGFTLPWSKVVIAEGARGNPNILSNITSEYSVDNVIREVLLCIDFFSKTSYRMLTKKSNIILDIGCGENVHSDATHALDFRDIKTPQHIKFIRHNLEQLPLPFSSDSVSKVYLSHVLEHLPKSYALKLLIDIRRIISDEGVVEIGVPNAYKAIKYLIESGTDDLEIDAPAWGTVASILWSIPLYEGAAHRYGYSGTTLERLLEESGFKIVWRNAYDWALMVHVKKK